MLQDKLESKMKARRPFLHPDCINQFPVLQGTRAEGAIARLFVGKMKSFIKCVNVNYESSRIEEFNGEKSNQAQWGWGLEALNNPFRYADIQLNVKGMRTLYDSFRDYVAVEMLDGENKYHAEGFGLQDARKGIIFESLPPVLHLQLKRYEYDMQRDAMVKVCVVNTHDEALMSF